jgi:hypothetical protein
MSLMSPVIHADSGHARIIRLSLVQGDVRFTRDANGDPLADSKATWDTAFLNLPIRQGYVIATDNGRAEVEFENGAMVFLNEHSVLEFYDLSLTDGALTTRLILRQGTISAHVHPSSSDYFSVTGGDFTVEATTRTSFRLDNFDDGSTVSVLSGKLSVLHNGETSALAKNQSLTMHAGDATVAIDRIPDNDAFDQWVSARVDSVSTATNTSLQYVNSPNYSSGFADLSTYGSWYSVGGFGNCWRPFGVGFGWSPFDMGSWYFDPFYGWSFVGFQPWGWAPYHYGSWIFAPRMGWVWVPSGFGYGRNPWRPVTAVFVHSGANVGLVPVHPTDKPGKKPVNIAQGVLNVPAAKISGTAVPANEKWKVLKTAPHAILSSAIAAAPAPARVSRNISVASGAAAPRVATPNQQSAITPSSITYDPREHRYVNNSNGPSSPAASAAPSSTNAAPASEARNAKESPATPSNGNSKVVGSEPATAQASGTTHISTNPNNVPPARATVPPPATRAATPPPARPMIVPPPPARSSGSNSGSPAPSHGGAGSGSAHPAPAHSAPAHRASSPAPSHSGGRPR